MQLQNFDEALQDYNMALEIEPDNAFAYINRGMTKKMLNDFDGAISDCNRAIQLNIFFTEAYIKRGIIYHDNKNFKQAVQDFNQSIKFEPNNPLPYFYRAASRFELLDYIGTLEDYNKVLELDSRNALTYFKRAALKAYISAYNDAIEDYDKVLEINPENVLTYYNRACIKHEIKDLEGAVKDYSKAIEIFPAFADAYLNRSAAYASLNKTSKAHEDYNKAIKLFDAQNNNYDSIYNAYADSAYYKKIMEFESDFNEGQTEFGRIQNQNIYIELERNLRLVVYDKDSADFSREEHNYNPEIISELYSAYPKYLSLSIGNDSSGLDTKRASQLELQFSEPENLKTKDAKYYFFIGLINGIQQNYYSAVNAFDQAISLDRDFLLAYFMRANIQYDMLNYQLQSDEYSQPISIGQVDDLHADDINEKQSEAFDQIITDYNTVIKLDPGFSFAYFNRANIKNVLGDYNGAIADYNKAIELNNELAEAYFNRALTLIFLNDTNKGCNDLSIAGELGIDNAYNVIKRYCTK